MNKMAARDKTEKKYLNDNTYIIEPISIKRHMLPRCLSTKITEMVLLQWTRWLPELKQEKLFFFFFFFLSDNSS